MAPLNIAFLRSGAQFATQATAELAKQAAVIGVRKPSTAHARLERFHRKTVAAAAAAAKARSAVKAGEMATLVNVGFLRSGDEFKPTAAETAGPADHSPVPSPKLSRNERLRRFHQQTLAAATTATATHTAPSTTIEPAPRLHPLNVGFLKSGHEFKPATSATAPVAEPIAVPSPKLSRSERLRRFHQKTLEAAGTANVSTASTTSTTSTAAPSTTTRVRGGRGPNRMTVAATRSTTTATAPWLRPVNIDFLKTGHEFKKVNAEAGDRIIAVARARRAAEGLSPQMSRHERLERFHAKTLRAAGRG